MFDCGVRTNLKRIRPVVMSKTLAAQSHVCLHVT